VTTQQRGQRGGGRDRGYEWSPWDPILEELPKDNVCIYTGQTAKRGGSISPTLLLYKTPDIVRSSKRAAGWRD
jgi:hypothetical protein